MQVQDNKSHGLLTATLLAVVVALVGLAGAVRIAQSAAALGPAVGDIIRFDPSSRPPRDMQSQLSVSRVGAPDCTLDLAAIYRGGGSLIIEQRDMDKQPVYRAHWAGQRSSAGADNCGSSADLVLDASSLDMLAMAAGGWGVAHQRLTPNSLWSQGGTTQRGR
jgi:hypothetical protein